MTDPLIAARCRLDGLVALVDTAHSQAALDAHPAPASPAVMTFSAARCSQADARWAKISRNPVSGIANGSYYQLGWPMAEQEFPMPVSHDERLFLPAGQQALLWCMRVRVAGLHRPVGAAHPGHDDATRRPGRGAVL